MTFSPFYARIRNSRKRRGSLKIELKLSKSLLTRNQSSCINRELNESFDNDMLVTGKDARPADTGETFLIVRLVGYCWHVVFKTFMDL